VINTVLYTYLIGWIITSVGLALTIRDQSRPASAIVAAGAIWPLLILGAAQLGAVALVAEAMRVREKGPKSIDDELAELLDEWRATGDAVARDRRLPAITGRDNAH
jgi:hypothetical protein